MIPDNVIEFFWEHVDVPICSHTGMTDTSACWNWKGFVHHRNGTPIIQKVIDDKLKEFQPRRISLELAGKPIESRVQIGQCKNKMCVNPNHLVTGDETRFWDKVVKPSFTDCWLWQGGKDKDQYGKFSAVINGKRIDIRAHRYSWMLANGIKISSKLLFVCHTCDEPMCVRPDHLFLGEVQDNVDDMVSKSRHAHGERQAAAKLTEQDVRDIRTLYTTGNYNMIQIANKYNVGRTAIGYIINGKSWKHVK